MRERPRARTTHTAHGWARRHSGRASRLRCCWLFSSLQSYSYYSMSTSTSNLTSNVVVLVVVAALHLFSTTPLSSLCRILASLSFFYATSLLECSSLSFILLLPLSLSHLTRSSFKTPLRIAILRNCVQLHLETHTRFINARASTISRPRQIALAVFFLISLRAKDFDQLRSGVARKNEAKRL